MNIIKKPKPSPPEVKDKIGFSEHDLFDRKQFAERLTNLVKDKGEGAVVDCSFAKILLDKMEKNRRGRSVMVRVFSLLLALVLAGCGGTSLYTDQHTVNYEAALFGVHSAGLYPVQTKPKLFIDPKLLVGTQLIVGCIGATRIAANKELPLPRHIEITPHESEATIVFKQVEPGTTNSSCDKPDALLCAVSKIDEDAGETKTTEVLVSSNILERVPQIKDKHPDAFTMLVCTAIAHELLHALGIQGHVPSAQFPQSIMLEDGEFKSFIDGNLRLPETDARVLRSMYGKGN